MQFNILINMDFKESEESSSKLSYYMRSISEIPKLTGTNLLHLLYFHYRLYSLLWLFLSQLHTRFMDLAKKVLLNFTYETIFQAGGTSLVRMCSSVEKEDR